MASTAKASTKGGRGAPVRASSRDLDRRAAVTDKREAIMGAALDLFVERGFHGTAVPEIAQAAGVGAGTIYRYFEHKEALVNALYRPEKQAFAARGPDGRRNRGAWTRDLDQAELARTGGMLNLTDDAAPPDRRARTAAQRSRGDS